MAVKLTINVADIAGTLLDGYTRIKIYRSFSETTNFSEITTPSSTLVLLSGESQYSFIDGNGTPAHWYRTTFYDPSGPIESTFSTSFSGEFYDLSFPNVEYELEAVYTNEDYLIIDKVRSLIGDRKELIRDYLSPDQENYNNVSNDLYSYTLSNPKGWPLKIKLDSVSYVTKADPVVYGYSMITFSGSQITTSGTLDLWYYHFKNSDSEILQVYNAFVPPAPLVSEDVTFELIIVCTAIDLLADELGAASSVAEEVDIFEEIRVNPKIGLDSRYNLLKSLLARKQAIIDEIVGNVEDDIFGVLID